MVTLIQPNLYLRPNKHMYYSNSTLTQEGESLKMKTYMLLDELFKVSLESLTTQMNTAHLKLNLCMN